VRRGRRDTAVGKGPERLSVPEHVADAVARRVAARDQDGAGAEVPDLPRRPADVVLRSDRNARDRRRLVPVRCHEVAHGEEVPAKSANPAGGEKGSTARRGEHRVEDDVLRPMTAQAGRNRPDGPCVPQHADLHRGGSEIGEDRVDLSGDEPGGERLDRGDVEGVLRGARDDDSRAVDGVRREGRDVRLDSGAPTRIGSRDRDDRDRADATRPRHPAKLADPLPNRPRSGKPG